ncbi:MAG: hypothetical protein RL033_5529 [Pseudomonadota bacterium]
MVRRFLSLCFVSLLPSFASMACHSPSADVAGSSPPVAAAAAAHTALVTPTLGGSVLAVGAQQLELAVLENGSVLGQVYDASGALVASAQLPQVAVDLRTKGGGRPHVELGWDPARGCLAGRAQLEAGLIAEPIDVSLALNGKVSRALLSGYAILPLARFGGSVLAVGPHAVELVVQGNTVLAYVLEASGQARAGADLTLQLQLAGADPLTFSWDAQRSQYRLDIDGQLDLSAQPLRLTLSAPGKSYAGAVGSLSGMAKTRLDARAQLSADAQLSAAGRAQLATPALEASAKAKLPAASLKASASAGASKLAAGKLAASKALSARVSAQAPSLKVSKSASSSASVKKPSAKASAGVKAGASFSFGK